MNDRREGRRGGGRGRGRKEKGKKGAEQKMKPVG